jgi:hypothetical protein
MLDKIPCSRIGDSNLNYSLQPTRIIGCLKENSTAHDVCIFVSYNFPKGRNFREGLKIFALCFSVFGFVSSFAHSDDQKRCEVKRTEDIEQFEHWLYSKRVEAFTKLNTTYKIPVVIHIIHTGEPLGEGFNYSAERIESQIRTLNEDFGRKEGTPGFNSHLDGEDSQIEFVLARIDPEGNPTNGIVRIDRI